MQALAGPYQPRVDAAGWQDGRATSREKWRANCDYLLTLVYDESVTIHIGDGSQHRIAGAGTWLIPPAVQHSVTLSGWVVILGAFFGALVCGLVVI